MQTFPQPNYPIPFCLNILNLSHYFLLCYWIFFRPSHLKYYLYQSNPKLYQAQPGKLFFRTFKYPAYRNLYLMFWLSGLLPVFLLGLPILLITGYFQHFYINWWGWFQCLEISTFLALTFWLSFGIGLGTTISIPRGIIAGISSAISVIVGFNLTAGILVALSNQEIILIKIRPIIAIFFGGMIGIALSIPIILVVGWAIGGLVGIVCGIISGISGSIFFGIVLNVLEKDNIILSLIIFAMMVGLAGSISYNVALNIARCVVVMSSIAIAVGIAVIIQLQITVPEYKFIQCLWYGLGTILIICFFGLRFHFYIYHWLLSWLSFLPLIKHPILWDELLLFPLPQTKKIINQQLLIDEKKGIYQLLILLCNPFQRWIAQRILFNYLHNHNSPLYCLYNILNHEMSNYYIFAPFTIQGWQKTPPIKNLVLAELSHKWLNTTADEASSKIEKILYQLTYYFRNRRLTPIINLTQLLYALENKREINNQHFRLSNYQHIYNNLDNYTGGEEIKITFQLMAKYLDYEKLEDFNSLFISVNNLSIASSIRPQIIECLQELEAIKNEVNTYFSSLIWSKKQAALLRIPELLQNLQIKINNQVNTSEKLILKRIVTQWIDIVTFESGKIGRGEINQEVPNPYIAGNPVTGELFFGRDDIMRKLQSLWNKDGQCSSVVLYGHRRMGKSSILQNLKYYLDMKKTIIVDFNLQFIGNLKNTSQFLYLLATEIYYTFERRFSHRLSKPQQESFQSYAYEPFRRFLNQVDQVRGHQKLIITIDEFEILENLINEGKIDKELISFLRGVFQTYQWFILAFAGLHTLKEMSYDYWHPLFMSVKPILVSFLDDYSATQLIQNPIPISYTDEAIKKIIRLTNNQPFLIQVICQELVEQYNQFLREGNQLRYFTPKMVESIVNTSDFFTQGSMASGYFNGVWKQAMYTEPKGQLNILRQLCHDSLSLNELVHKTQLNSSIVEKALDTLQRHDAIKKENNNYSYTVELMRRWVQNYVAKNRNQNDHRA